jgi:GTPase SAR1 family protein
VDTAGTDEFKSVREASLKQKDGYIYVYDVTNLTTLNNLDSMLSSIKNQNEL